MRRPITIQAPQFDIDTVQPEIDQICGGFDRYLALCSRPTSASKHAVMGAVGKVISEIKSGRADRGSLKGYALRVHELKEFPSPDAIGALALGIDRLVDLLQREDVPAVARDRILDRIDFGVYYRRRWQEIERREAYNIAFREYLKRKHSTLDALSQGWGARIDSWDRVYAFGPRSRTFDRANAMRRGDMENFREEWRQTTAEQDVEPLEEEETV